LEEFQNQTDPRTADTDGDGFSDAFEVANGMNPTTPEDFTPTEPDADNNGRIDHWENAPYIYGFTDSGQNGFDDIYELYYIESASDENFDIVVEIYTTRSAVLTWNGGLDGIVVLPTTNDPYANVIVQNCWGGESGTNVLRINVSPYQWQTDWVFPTNVPVVFFAIKRSSHTNNSEIVNLRLPDLDGK
jgi:hypothetical protein